MANENDFHDFMLTECAGVYQKAREHRRNKSKMWLDYCERKGIDPEQERRGQMRLAVEETEIPDTPAAKYRRMEERAYKAAASVQTLLETAIETGENILDIKTLTSTFATALSAYKDANKARLEQDLLQGELIPATLIDAYKQEFYPALAQGVDNLRQKMLAALPETMRAPVQLAFVNAYPAYADAAEKAERALQNVIDNAPAVGVEQVNKRRFTNDKQIRYAKMYAEQRKASANEP